VHLCESAVLNLSLERLSQSGGIVYSPIEESWLQREAARSLARIWPRVRERLGSKAETLPSAFEQRLSREWPRLFSLLHCLYGTHYDFFYHLEELALALARSAAARPEELRRLDEARERNPMFFQSQRMLGAIAYVNLYAGTLPGICERLGYLEELGATYLHLMPLFRSPVGENDGGYAVSSYREVDPRLGTMDNLRSLATELRHRGISLCLDFVFNHTAENHEWAKRAKTGDEEFGDYSLTFPDRTIPDEYEKTLREIFPTVRRGSFTWNETMQRWVWTTFHSYQWDLNYANPSVFRAMAGEMLFLANIGVEVMRLDAVAFIWKRMGTNCENQPEAHQIIQAMNAIARIAAPALTFKSEAIVHPDEVIRYISPGECQLSYNPLLMALLWEALATREVKLLAHSLARRNELPEGTSWVNYLRCHDDIGWTFDDVDAWHVAINPTGHRHFLNQFYINRFEGSFSRGVPFQENPETGDARVSGMLASLAGLEAALQLEEPAARDQAIATAINRIVLLHAVMLAVGGIPLIYLGDEIALMNNYDYEEDSDKREDSRWVHRVRYPWERADERKDPSTPAGMVYTRLRHLLAVRRGEECFAGNQLEIIHSGNPHVLVLLRKRGGQQVWVVANFSEQEQEVSTGFLPAGANYIDLISGQRLAQDFTLSSHRALWLKQV